MTAQASEQPQTLTLVPGASVRAALNLTEADRALIAAARRAFSVDFRYLEQVLWQARQRLPEAQPGLV